MGGVLRCCLQCMLKLVNSLIGIVGIAMILYSARLIRVWQREIGGGSPFVSPDSSAPWFIYSFLGLGVTLCVITCSGHIAADIANGFCLFLYIFFLFLLLIVEAGVFADVFLNHDWEEDFPEDPTGSFNDFKKFIKSNFDICKWIGCSIVAVQGLCILLAMVLKALGPYHYYDSDDDDYIQPRLPLLKNAVHSPSYVVVDPTYRSKNDSWNVWINDKMKR